ncbi:MAG: thiamine pyrophosphate-binding protein [Pseudomonadales bacterium]|jgi:acetolactate synthase-1/2/3 large subunit|nr:thiamine pyrophosphate-binding protein [Arenicellales bacterium]MDP7596249.1 thiamine pyrophosphate-binding protein [Pseudomonadales bacterium]HJN51468.1 thiamine pyrophosphate-binding protein [Pseudomonadales bacterium]|tara:strand:+ start:929 stop:2563 length:1635 start_codon:yes stop_codon:yes gene_type:complete
MAAMTGGDAVYDTLVALGVKHVFGIPSVHNIPIYDAIHRGGAITPIAVRHEQGALHAADGYARVTGSLGVAITSTGPGASNGMTGLFEAGFASSRVLMITGQTETQHYGKGKGVLHEAENQLSMLRSVTRSVGSPRRSEEIAPVLIRVARDICTGRPQPGAIEIPVDLQYGQVQVEIPAPGETVRIPADTALLTEAGAMLGSSAKRVIWAGGGVISSGASEELLRLAEALNAPVFTTINGRGAIPEDHPLCMGAFIQQCREFVPHADVMLAVGTRFQGGSTADFSLQLPARLIHLDADPQMIGLNYKPDLALVGDAKLGLAGILEALNAEPGDDEFCAQIEEACSEAKRGIRERMGPDYERIMDSIRILLPRDGNIVRDPTVPAYIWANSLLPILTPGTSLQSTSSAIGPGLPLAIGAALGSGRKTVVIQGDGGFMLSIAELATAAQHQVPVVVCVFNDQGYGVLRMIQAARFEGRTTAVDLSTPDFAAVAEAMGVEGVSVKGSDQFHSAFAQAMQAKGPVLLDIDMGSLEPMQGFGPPRRRSR